MVEEGRIIRRDRMSNLKSSKVVMLGTRQILKLNIPKFGCKFKVSLVAVYKSMPSTHSNVVNIPCAAICAFVM